MMAASISVGDTESEKIEYFFTIVSDWETVSNLMKNIHYEATEHYDDDILPMEISTPRVHHPENLRQSLTMPLPYEMGKHEFDEDGNDEDYNAAIATIATVCNIPSVKSPARPKPLPRKVDKLQTRQCKTTQRMPNSFDRALIEMPFVYPAPQKEIVPT
eukprot:7418335-Ditylum_brightwellii.AAC.1